MLTCMVANICGHLDDPCCLYLQILCLAEQIRFSVNCENAIKNGGLVGFAREVEGQLESYTSVDLGDAGGGEEAQVGEMVL